MKRVAIVQSAYIPWKGYFDLINSVDEFILYDDRQYTRRDWRNRNRIKTAQGPKWLTIPVAAKGRYSQRIDETRIIDPTWPRRHWKAISTNYGAAPFFPEYHARLDSLYLDCSDELLSLVNRRFLDEICDILGITTLRTLSTDYQVAGAGTERLVALCRAAGATHYLSGPKARDYIAPEQFEAAGIELEYFDYSGYPDYEQLHQPFDHAVTIIDLILSVGADAPRFMKSFP